MLVSVSNSQNVNRFVQRISVEKIPVERMCFLNRFQKTLKYRTNTKKDLSFSIRKDLFFFVSQRKNAIITRFVKYGGLEQNLHFDL